MVPRCLDVAESFAKNNEADIEVIDIRTLVPLDKQALIDSARKTGRVLVVHEACQTGGFGGELVSTIVESDAFFYLDAPVKRLGGLDVPIPYNPQLEAQVVPTEEKITAAVRDLL
jgi:pyruvate dehydrogenase E1 component beta subunit